jgi:hypothetical protein
MERKILYFHIAKTGGSTIVKVLRENGLDDGVLSAKGTDVEGKNEYFKKVVDEWDKYFKFAFVRDKYDLLVSLWHYDKSKFKKTGRDFATFISDYVVPSKDEYDYWIDQYYLTVGDKNLFIFDQVCYFSQFSWVFNDICETIGIKYKNEKVNVGPYDHSVPYWTRYTPDIQQQVYNKFKQEIDYFGFENPLFKS